MRALTISRNGGLDQIELRDDLPIPALRGPDDVRIRVRAAALNHLDLFVVGGLPGVTEGGLGDLARNTDRRVTKRELVILLKPTVIQSDANWEQDLRETRGRLERMKQ